MGQLVASAAKFCAHGHGTLFARPVVAVFAYCSSGMIEIVQGHSWFEGSCLPKSTFLYATSLLPFVLVCLQVNVS